MKTVFQASVKVAGSYPGCEDVQVKTVEEIPPESYRLAAIYLGLKPGPVIPVEYLTWRLSKKRQVDLTAVTDKLLKVETVSGLVGFMQEAAVLFPGNKILLADALRFVWLFRCFVSAQKDGLPSPDPDIETWTMWPLTVQKADGSGTAFSFVPVPAKSGWPLFRKPKRLLGFSEEEENAGYVFEEIRQNVFRRLRYVDICWEGKIVVKPACLFDALLAAHCLAKPRAIALGTKNKQDAITFFRVYKQRGKISEEEFTAVKQAISQAWEEGEDDLAGLKEIGREAVRACRG